MTQLLYAEVVLIIPHEIIQLKYETLFFVFSEKIRNKRIGGFTHARIMLRQLSR